MLGQHIRLSDNYTESLRLQEEVENLYRRGLEMVSGFTLYGYSVNVNNPKEVIAALFLLADDYNRFHERF